MKYLFILGRNIELSKLEVLSFFEKENNPSLNHELRDNSLLIEVKNPIKENEIDNLGGIISIGEVLTQGNENTITNEIEKEILYNGKNNKLNYCLWEFSDNSELIQDYLKKRFKSEKLKATLKHLSDDMDLQGGEKVSVTSSKRLDEEYFIFGNENKEYFGKIKYHCDYKEIENRDMQKPVRRQSLAISPRLAKILINLSLTKSNETLLDPFCGIGTILQEALLQNIKVIGVDKDKDAIKGANQNLNWFKFNKENYELINFDSANVEVKKFNSIVTEPDLGTTLRKIPTKEKAKETIEKFEKLMVRVINNLKSNMDGKIVFTSPYIRIGKKRIHCNIENICERTNCTVVHKEIPEFRHGQVIGRMIYVLKK